MYHDHRIPNVERMAQAPFRITSVLVHKPSLLEPETFQEKHRLYRYIVRYLLERVAVEVRVRPQALPAEVRRAVWALTEGLVLLRTNPQGAPIRDAARRRIAQTAVQTRDLIAHVCRSRTRNRQIKTFATIRDWRPIYTLLRMI